MYNHQITFAKEESINAFAVAKNARIESRYSVPCRHHQMVGGEDVYGKDLPCAEFSTDVSIGGYHGYTDAGGNAIRTLSDEDDKRFFIQSTHSLNQ